MGRWFDLRDEPCVQFHKGWSTTLQAHAYPAIVVSGNFLVRLVGLNSADE